MNWPWHASTREDYLNLRVTYLERDLATAHERERYWRERYERLADLALVRQVNPNAVAAVHVEPKTDAVATIGARIGKIAGVMGAARGIPFETLHHAQAADTQDR